MILPISLQWDTRRNRSHSQFSHQVLTKMHKGRLSSMRGEGGPYNWSRSNKTHRALKIESIRGTARCRPIPDSQGVATHLRRKDVDFIDWSIQLRLFPKPQRHASSLRVRYVVRRGDCRLFCSRRPNNAIDVFIWKRPISNFRGRLCSSKFVDFPEPTNRFWGYFMKVTLPDDNKIWFF